MWLLTNKSLLPETCKPLDFHLTQINMNQKQALILIHLNPGEPKPFIYIYITRKISFSGKNYVTDYVQISPFPPLHVMNWSISDPLGRL